MKYNLQIWTFCEFAESFLQNISLQVNFLPHITSIEALMTHPLGLKGVLRTSPSNSQLLRTRTAGLEPTHSFVEQRRSIKRGKSKTLFWRPNFHWWIFLLLAIWSVVQLRLKVYLFWIAPRGCLHRLAILASSCSWIVDNDSAIL